MVIRTRVELEGYAHHLASNTADIPENIRLLVIMEPADFDAMIADTVPPWAQAEGASDRFIYNSQAGIEFGVKKKDYGV